MSEPFIGEIKLFAGDFAPRNWAICDGQLVDIAPNTALFSLLGTTYGGNGRTTFGLPDLRGRAAIHPGTGLGLSTVRWGERGGSETVQLNVSQMPTHQHNASAEIEATTNDGNRRLPDASHRLAAAKLGTGHNVKLYRTGPPDEQLGGLETGNLEDRGGGQSHANMQPFLTLNYIIALTGIDPGGDTPFIGQIKLFGGSFAPSGWMFCNGQLLQIADHQALFSILGTTYGDDGDTGFALPDLRGRVAIGPRQGAGLSNRRLGERHGTENELLQTNHLPSHNHAPPTTVQLRGHAAADGNRSQPGAAHVLGKFEMPVGGNLYSDAEANLTQLNGATVEVGNNGGNQAHENRQPYIGVHYIIAVSGVAPSET